MPSQTTDAILSVHGNMTLLVPSNTSSYRSLASGQYEHDVVIRLPSLVRNGMSVVDVGANVGYYTLLLSRLVGETGVVHAFEPDPDLFHALVHNVTSNRLANTKVVSSAVGDEVGSATFVRARHRMGGFVGRTPEALSLGEPVAVETVTLDYYFAALGSQRVDLIKMDIEGGELAALAGMRHVAAHNPGLMLIMEYNPAGFAPSGSSGAGLLGMLSELEFSRCRLFELGMRELPLKELASYTQAFNVLLTRA
jgi:FkbM family methyltransferase